MKVLLYTYFYNISLNVLRPAFFRVYNLPFSASLNIGKIRVKVGQKVATFPNLWAPVPTELQFSITFIRWYVAKQSQTKLCQRFSSFEIFFE